MNTKTTAALTSVLTISILIICGSCTLNTGGNEQEKSFIGSSPTNTPTAGPTRTPTPSPTNTPATRPTRTPTPPPTNTPAARPTRTPTPPPTNTPAARPTRTPTPSLVSTRTQTCNLETTNNSEFSTNPIDWPPVVEDEWLNINGLSNLIYPDSQDPYTTFLNLMNYVNRSDETGAEDNKGDKIILTDGKSIPIWYCGYEYILKTPPGYLQSRQYYPLVIFLHGGGESQTGDWHWLTKQFYIPDNDPYILAVPAKIEWDWHSDKIQDVIEDIKSNLRINVDRIYLTGLSMGGRGAFIVASDLPDYFAALLPLSSHHGPYSYEKFVDRISHLPIWMTHGDLDRISSYDVATRMAEALEIAGGYVRFDTILGGGHDGWGNTYGDSATFKWLMSQEKNTPHNYQLSVLEGTGSGYYEKGTLVLITASESSDKKIVITWKSSSGGVFKDVTSVATTFTMPGNDVTVSPYDN